MNITISGSRYKNNALNLIGIVPHLLLVNKWWVWVWWSVIFIYLCRNIFIWVSLLSTSSLCCSLSLSLSISLWRLYFICELGFYSVWQVNEESMGFSIHWVCGNFVFLATKTLQRLSLESSKRKTKRCYTVHISDIFLAPLCSKYFYSIHLTNTYCLV